MKSQLLFGVLLLLLGPGLLPLWGQGFIPNQGQIIDEYGQPNEQVLYLLPLGNGLNVQLRASGFSYDAYRVLPDGRVHFQRVDLDFIGASAAAKLSAEQPLAEELHFPSRSASHLRPYRKITYHELYPHIDLEFVVSGQGAQTQLEYNFVLHAGARLSDIQLRYAGARALNYSSQRITLHLAQGQLIEDMPRSYLASSGQPVAIRYRHLNLPSQELVMGFVGPDDLITDPVVIDPIPRLDWGAYLGGSDEDGYRDLAIDRSGGFLYAVGSSRSLNAIATAGAYQNTLGGNSDLILSKFTLQGVRLWSTYYGGPSDEFGQGIALDGQGNIYLTGTTASLSGVAAPMSHQSVYGGGGADAFVARFDATGQRSWATYLGGSGDEFANALAADDQGNIWITGWTDSPNAVATPGAFQSSFSGQEDAFLVRFNAMGVRQWGTYLGGDDFDFGLQVAAAPNGDAFISGWTSSLSGISTAGAHQATYGGGTSDAFLARFSSQGQRQWATYYGGSIDEYGDALHLDTNGDVLLAGPGGSPDGLATPAAHQSTLQGTYDAFLVRFNGGGQRQWGTYYGGSCDETGYGLSTAPDGSIYLSGFSCSTDGIATANAHQTSYGGGDWDAFLVRFTASGQRQWATYYGGENTDQGFAVVADANQGVYLTGITGSVAAISTPNAHQTGYGGGNTDAFLARFTPCDAALPLVASSNSPLCEGGQLELTASGAAQYSWLGPDGFTSALPNPVRTQATLSQTGTYRLVGTDAQGCTDTLLLSVSIHPAPTFTTPAPRFCAGEPIVLNAAGGTSPLSYALAGGPYQNSGSFASRPAGSYPVYLLDANLCADTITLVVSAPPRITQVAADTLYCQLSLGSIRLEATGSSALSYSLDGLMYTSNPAFGGLPAGPYQLYVRDEAGCVTDTTATLLSVEPPVIGTIDVDPGDCVSGLGDIFLTPRYGSPPFEYSINGGSSFQPDSSFMDVGPGLYTLVIRDARQCTASAQAEMPGPGNLFIEDLRLSANRCTNGQNTLLVLVTGGTGPLTYSLNGGSPQVSFVFLNLPPGPYTVTVADPQGCQVSARDSVPEAKGPRIDDISIRPSTCSQSNGSISLKSSGGQGSLSYSLNNGPSQASPNFDNLGPARYTVTVVDAQGCTQTREVELPPAQCPVYMPNAFSPNDDGVNDHLRLFVPDGIQGDIRLFEVFDRWGALVHSAPNTPADDPASWWNGKVKGEAAAAGVYLYHATLNLGTGETITLSGEVVLIR